jgi:hypothetical protein
MGLASALVQKPELSEKEIRASSTAGIVIGLACLAVVWILAPPSPSSFGRPRSRPSYAHWACHLCSWAGP